MDELRAAGGVVDYVVGAQPNPGVFCLGTHDDPKQRHYLNLYKLGEGPLYSFYVPYHLCHFETPTSIARAVIYGDPTTAPDGAPKVEVVTIAKVDLKAGQELDRYGGYLHYGEAEKATIAAAGGSAPAGRRGWLRPHSGHPEGPGSDLRRREAPGRPALRPAPR